MENVTQGLKTENSNGHKFGSLTTHAGYVVCSNCGVHENQDGIQYPCGSDAQRLAVQKANMAEKLTVTVQENNRMRQLLTRVVSVGMSDELTAEINAEIGRAI